MKPVLGVAFALAITLVPGPALAGPLTPAEKLDKLVDESATELESQLPKVGPIVRSPGTDVRLGQL